MIRLHDAPAYRLYRAQRLLRAHLLGVLSEVNLSPEQYFVMMRLAEAGSLPQGELGDPALDDRASVSRQVSGLERRGLLSRTPRPEDSRVSVVRLTPAGVALLAELTPIVLRERARLFQDVSPVDLATFTLVLSRLEARLLEPR